jgi:site-specific DNA recombinase
MLNADKAEELVLSSIKGITSEALIDAYNKILSNKKNKIDFIKDNQVELEKQIENNNKMVQSLIRKLALLDDNPIIISEFQKEINNLKTQNTSLEQDLLNLRNLFKNTDPKLDYIDDIGDKLEDFQKLFECIQSINKKRSYLLEIVTCIVWDSKNKKLQVNLFNSTSSIPIGGVKRRGNNNLSLENGSR